MCSRWFKWGMVVWVWIVLAGISGIPVRSAISGEMPLFRIGTGGLMGVYYPIGRALGMGFSSTGTADGRVAVAQTSGGSVANVRALAKKEIEAALVQADVAFRALKGTGPFSGEKTPSLQAIASLYPERLQMMVRKDAGIHGVRDMKNKTVSLDESGSGTLAVMRIVLDAYGLRETDLNPVYLKPEFTIESLAQRRLDGISLMSGTPAPAIAQIMSPQFSLVPVDPEIAATIHQRHPYLLPGVIPADTYPGVPEIPTLEVYALLVVREDVDEALVYELTKTLWNAETQRLLQAAHPLGHAITMQSALHGLTLALHPGAVQFYRQHHALPEGDAIP
ncbi:TAXI family TRAP transporter solute-binding subunit [Desulfotignum phosphitoxidans]|uniref:TRAP transporter solute receptor, TAXI family n=1 Tax=Desulfotignum phosphitoxidans DSM 13687 TaxID=1286635 RepID=S0G855_9BACT|nr:TAXI family TRAP transporter solute-binding subunit [Desulfotignum phosphitoxidans]EMS81717.1 TRAP transporter solute receptor, TAXI family [Desulfotignum phosphitoxidans DSM 13687]